MFYVDSIRGLMREAYEKDSADNIAIIVARILRTEEAP